jgi:hypothetical protein
VANSETNVILYLQTISYCCEIETTRQKNMKISTTHLHYRLLPIFYNKIKRSLIFRTKKLIFKIRNKFQLEGARIICDFGPNTLLKVNKTNCLAKKMNMF